MVDLRAELASSHSIAEDSPARLVLRRHWLNYVFPGLLLLLAGIPGLALLATGRGDESQRIVLALWGALCPLSGVALALWGFVTRTQRVVFDKARGELRLGRRRPIPLGHIRNVKLVTKEHGTRDERGRRQEVHHVKLVTRDEGEVHVMNTLHGSHARRIARSIEHFVGLYGG